MQVEGKYATILDYIFTVRYQAFLKTQINEHMDIIHHLIFFCASIFVCGDVLDKLNKIKLAAEVCVA